MKTLPHRNCVSIGRNCSTKFDHIYEDFFDGTCDAIEYLIKTGCKKIGYLTDDLMVPKREEKVRAYLSTLEKHDLKPIYNKYCMKKHMFMSFHLNIKREKNICQAKINILFVF